MRLSNIGATICGRDWCLLAVLPQPMEAPVRSGSWGLSFPPVSVMTSDDSLLLLLRRLDELERKLDCILEELQTPTAIGYSARRGNRPRND